MKDKKIPPIKNTLLDLIKKWKHYGIDKKGIVLEAWKTTVPKETFKKTKPKSFRKGRLIIDVSDASRLYTLTLEREKLIERFNESYKGKMRLKEIRFRIGDVEENKQGNPCKAIPGGKVGKT